MHGSRVSAQLEGNSALLLGVVDRETQAPHDLYSATVTLRNVNTFPNVFPVHAGKTPLPGGRIGGMFPCDCTVAVSAGDLVGEAAVDGLQAGETRPVRIEVRPASSVSGRVTYDDGAPAAGTAVALVRPALDGDSDASPLIQMGGMGSPEGMFRRELATTTSDQGGGFRLVAPRDGSYLVRAAMGDGTDAFSELFTLAGEHREGLELVLSRPGSISGTIHAPAGAAVEGLTVWIRPDLPGGRGGELIHRTSAALGADGRYSISSVRSGPATVYLALPPFVRHGGGWSSISQWSIEHPYGGVELGTVEIPAGGTLEQDFTPADFPGTLELHVRVNGRPAPRLALRIRGQDPAGDTLEVETDDQGVFGPWPIFAGVWSIEAVDPDTGWSQEHPDPISVAAASPTIAELDLERP